MTCMANMKKHLFFDLDDTLIITNPIYDYVKNKTGTLLYNFLNSEHVTLEEVLKTFNDIDLANAKTYGLKPDRYLHSWEQTYIYFVEKLELPLVEEHKKMVRESANEVFTTKIGTYPNVKEVLQQIKATGHEMNILTAGERSMQMKRITDAELENYFDNIYVVPYKDPEVMKNIMGGRNLENCVMIGNSLKSDVFPALSNNILTIHIPQETWDYDKHDVCLANPKYVTISDISDLPTTVSKMCTA